LDENSVAADPIVQLGAWLEEARTAGQPLPEAMTVATASADGEPAARMVLLRGLDHRGVVFFTDRSSAKGRDLSENPKAAVVFHWLVPRHRQVRLMGPVETVSDAESDAYWASRPVGARRSAIASHQSEVIPDRKSLEEQVSELARTFPAEADLQRPVRWGGYRIVPHTVELWEEQPDRLHDRLRYRRRGDGHWLIERLAP